MNVYKLKVNEQIIEISFFQELITGENGFQLTRNRLYLFYLIIIADHPSFSKSNNNGYLISFCRNFIKEFKPARDISPENILTSRRSP